MLRMKRDGATCTAGMSRHRHVSHNNERPSMSPNRCHCYECTR